MDDRVKAGYTITDSIQIGETEFVLGKRGGSFPMYVTWACKGGDNYYWGHYFGDLLEAQKDLLARAGEEVEFQMMRQGKSDSESKQKESAEHICSIIRKQRAYPVIFSMLKKFSVEAVNLLTWKPETVTIENIIHRRCYRSVTVLCNLILKIGR